MQALIGSEREDGTLHCPGFEWPCGIPLCQSEAVRANSSLYPHVEQEYPEWHKLLVGMERHLQSEVLAARDAVG